MPAKGKCQQHRTGDHVFLGPDKRESDQHHRGDEPGDQGSGDDPADAAWTGRMMWLWSSGEVHARRRLVNGVVMGSNSSLKAGTSDVLR
jgi:hypothetical protein